MYEVGKILKSKNSDNRVRITSIQSAGCMVELEVSGNPTAFYTFTELGILYESEPQDTTLMEWLDSLQLLR